MCSTLKGGGAKQSYCAQTPEMAIGNNTREVTLV